MAAADTVPRPRPCLLPRVLPRVPYAQDPAFAILLGMVEQDICGVLPGRRLRYEVRRSGRESQLPLPYLQEVSRLYVPGQEHPSVTLVATQDLDLPLPYKVLIYQPGSIRTTAVMQFEEWNLGDLHLEPEDGRPEVFLEEVRLWGVTRGRMELDVDAWLDRMLGSRLDDSDILGFALFRYEGQLLGMAMGYNKEGRGRSGAFSFEKDRIIFPSPPGLKAAGAYLRGRLEQFLPVSAATRRG